VKRGVKNQIVKLLKERPGWHPTARIIYEHLKGKMPGLAFSSVYRALLTLSNEKKIRGFTLDSEDEKRYEIYTKSHPHFKCTECGRVYDIDIDINLAFKELVEVHTGHIVKDVHITYFGICNECLRKKVKKIVKDNDV